MTRQFKDYEWTAVSPDGKHYVSVNYSQILSVLMDVRDELKRLNNVIQCHNFIAVPSKLDAIVRNTRKRKRPKVGKPSLRVVSRG